MYKRMVISKKDLELFLIFFIFIKPVILAIYPFLDNLNNVCRMAIFVYIAVKYLVKKQLSKVVIWSCIFELSMLISTISGHGSIVKWVTYAMPCIAMIMLLDLYKSDFKRLINILLVVFEILIYLNFITMILAPSGLYSMEQYSRCWILGMKNNFSSYFACAMVVALIHSSLFKNKRRTYSLIIVMMLSALIGGSSTLILGISLFIVLVFLNRGSMVKFLNYRNYTILYIILFFVLVVFRMMEMFSFLIVDVMDKDLTLTYRTFMWDKALDTIPNHLFWGVGLLDGQDWMKYIGIEHSQLHNQILDYTFNGGIILTGIALIINIFIGKQLMKNVGNTISNYITVGIFVIHIMMLTESFYAGWIYIVFGLGYFVDYLIMAEKNENVSDRSIKRIK